MGKQEMNDKRLELLIKAVEKFTYELNRCLNEEMHENIISFVNGSNKMKFKEIVMHIFNELYNNGQLVSLIKTEEMFDYTKSCPADNPLNIAVKDAAFVLRNPEMCDIILKKLEENEKYAETKPKETMREILDKTGIYFRVLDYDLSPVGNSWINGHVATRQDNLVVPEAKNYNELDM